MTTLNNERKMKCSSRFKTIQKTQKSIECLTCMNRFHAASACTGSFNSSIGNNTIDLCQNCLAESLPFQTLDDLLLLLLLLLLLMV